MLDKEWIKLILEAKHLGLTTEEIRAYLQRGETNDVGTGTSTHISVGQ